MKKHNIDKIYDSQPAIRESPISQCIRELENFKTKTEWIYEFNHDHTGLLPEVEFIMNNQLFKVIETEGTKIRAKKIMKNDNWIFELSSGYNGYRCKNCSTWIYEFNEKICNCNKPMKTKKHKVEIPEGMKVKRELWPTCNSLQVTVEFEPIKQLPKTWEDYFRKNGDKTFGSHVWVENKYKPAFVALYQLIALRDVYNDGEDFKEPCSIYYEHGVLSRTINIKRGPLVFNSDYLGVQFVTNFRKLLEDAKPLL